MNLLECVPNFSDGKDPHVLSSILGAIQRTSTAKILDASQDADHNRAVVTFVAEPEHAVVAAFEAISVARDLIDLRAHQGVHPRMGATDVCPFVPLDGVSMAACVEAARRLASQVGSRLGIPVFLYGEAARRPERRELPAVRRGGFEFLRERMGSDPRYEPDEGPAAIHPSAGATAIGARRILIAFNVNLDTSDLEVARKIAGGIRESNAGLPGVRALGLELKSRGRVQVSVNVCDPRRTSLIRVFDEVDDRARALGVRALSSELIGLAPASTLDADVARHIRLEGGFEPRRVLERAMEST